jgi:CDP-glycerol glycerophosphotransferase (TagB/SpsB family)
MTSDDGQRVAFHLLWEFHRTILEPIYEEVRRHFPALITNDAEAVIAYKPRVLVLADGHYQMFRGHLPETAIIWTRHGFASKNHTQRATTGCDFACFSSEWVLEDFERRGLRPRVGAWVTGFVPVDSLLHGPQRRRSHPPTILFAPTHDPSLSAAPLIGELALERLCNDLPNVRVVIKPHPVTPDRNPEWMEAWRRVAHRYPAVDLIEDSHSNVYELARDADVLVSDVSSVIFYFLALDKPIVLVDSPEGLRDPCRIDPEGPEWIWRDLGLRIDSPEKLSGAVQRCLLYPEERADIRAEYRKRVFGERLDGRASELIAKKISMLLRPAPEERTLVELAWNSIRTYGAYEQQLKKKAEELSTLKKELRALKEDLRRSRKAYEALSVSLPLRLARSLNHYPLVKRGLRAVIRKLMRTP